MLHVHMYTTKYAMFDALLFAKPANVTRLGQASTLSLLGANKSRANKSPARAIRHVPDGAVCAILEEAWVQRVRTFVETMYQETPKGLPNTNAQWLKTMSV